MLLAIPGVLNTEQLQTARHLLSSLSFQDGRQSAGLEAVRDKHNQEVPQDSPGLRELNNLVMGSLVRNSTYLHAALPQGIAAPFYARYTPGMHYGQHVDDPVMGPPGGRYRSDIAITIFLSSPQEYAGGELMVRTAFGEQSVKLPAGDAVLYPASSLHRVDEVTEGERLVAVTWVQSLVRDAGQRELLYELHLAREALLQQAPDSEATKRVSNTYTNLVRRWSEI